MRKRIISILAWTALAVVIETFSNYVRNRFRYFFANLCGKFRYSWNQGFASLALKCLYTKGRHDQS
jgi:hypothetical protein